MAVDFKTNIDPGLLKAFNDYADKVQNLSDFWRQKALPLIIDEIRGVFDTQGFGKWPDRKTAASHPLLRDTGRLYNSWTKPGAAGNIHRITRDKIEFGTDIEYAKYHEYGTGHIPPRPIAKLVTQTRRGARKSLRRRVMESLARYLTKDFK